MLPSPTAQACPACLLQGPWATPLLTPQKPWSTSPAAPCLPAHSHWSRLGGLRSWSAITLAEKLYRFNMFWKKESSETSYCGNSGRKEESERRHVGEGESPSRTFPSGTQSPPLENGRKRLTDSMSKVLMLRVLLWIFVTLFETEYHC